jgi:hypothetical protein
MTRRVPPKVGVWLLQRLGRGSHLESLVGDLIEQCGQGKSKGWAWREILVAIFVAQTRSWRLSVGIAMARFFWWGLTEAAIIVSLTLIADRSRTAVSFGDMFSASFVATLLVLLCVAGVGLRSSIRLHRHLRGRAAVHFLAIFVLMSLSVGTLTWAETH